MRPEHIILMFSAFHCVVTADHPGTLAVLCAKTDVSEGRSLAVLFYCTVDAQARLGKDITIFNTKRENSQLTKDHCILPGRCTHG